MFTAFIGGLKGSNSKNEQIKLVGADMNHFCGRWVGHEWAACSFLEWPVL